MKENQSATFAKMGKNLIWGTILGRLPKNWAHQIFCKFYLY